MKKYIIKYSLSVALLLPAGQAMSQGIDPSQVFQGLSLGISGGDMVSVAGSMYIGPGTYQINGQWTIYSKNVAIDPNARIQGAGQIRFGTLSDAGWVSTPTFIDGNANKIGLNVLQANKSGLTLTNIDFPAELTRAGFINKSDNNTLYMNNTLNLVVPGSNVHLNGNELRLGLAGGITTDLTSRVLTDNDPLSAIVKEQVDNFTFPLGIDAPGDRSDVTIVSQTSQDIRISVVDSAAAIDAGVRIAAPDKGVNRFWNISNVGGASGVTSDLMLINTTGNGNDYEEAKAFITQSQANDSWSFSDYPGYRAKGTHVATAIFSTDKTRATAWFSKTSADAKTLASLKMGFTANGLSGSQGTIRVYPNPTTNRVHVAGLSGSEKILVMDGAGRTLSSLTAAGNTSASIDLSSYVSGVYNIVVMDGQSKQHRSVVKQ